LYIVLKWLHQGCDSDLSLDFFNFGVGEFLFFASTAACVTLLSFAAESCELYGNGWGKVLQQYFFLALVSDLVLELLQHLYLL